MEIKKIYEFDENNLAPTKSFEIKDELNPDVWNGLKIKEDIKEKLIEISNEYINSIYGDFEVKDIILTGSLSSYNWSEYSDFDVHVVINYVEINDDVEFVEEYLNLKKKKFNKEFDIKIYGYEVEFHVENIGEDRSHVNGIFSILNDKWVKKPNTIDKSVIDTKLIEEKSINIMEEVDELEIRVKEVDMDSYEELKDELDTIWDKIKKSRRDGLESPDGEFAIGNSVFKYLRRNDYIGKVLDMKKKIVEIKYSI